MATHQRPTQEAAPSTTGHEAFFPRDEGSPGMGDTLRAATAAVGMSGAADHLAETTLSPIFGPVDAPHLRYIPSYFSNQIPDKLKQFFPAIASQFHQARVKIYHLLWYKPPVGIVSVWGFMRVMERLYGIYSPPAPTSGQEALADAEGKLSGIIKTLMPNSASRFTPWGRVGQAVTVEGQGLDDLKARLKHEKLQLRRKKRRKMYRKGRSFDLDRGDLIYNNFGGIETVRVRACQEGLRAALALSDDALHRDDSPKKSLFGNKRSQDSDMESKTEYTRDIETAIRALQLSCAPRGSREYFVEQSIDALSNLRKYLTPANNESISGKAPSIHEQNLQLLLAFSSKLIELRTLDALLRTLRDRHLVVSYRLRRAQNYWKWHVNLSSGRLGRLAQRIRYDVMSILPWGDLDFRDRNQKEYERITAACERELLWLGSVEKLLLERPVEMDADDMFSVLSEKKRKGQWWTGLLFEADSFEDEDSNDLSSEAKFASTVNLLVQGQNRMWLRQSENWTKRARNVIADSLDATVRSSFTPIGKVGPHDASQNIVEHNGTIYAESEFLQKWASYDEAFSDSSSWLAVLSLVDYAASTQRAGEQRHFQFSDLTMRIKQYDFLGIPSSALMLAAANSLHDNIIAPHSQEIIQFIKSIFQAIWGIIEFRFYTPMKDIVLDLLNRRPRMVDPFALMNEQISLDNMLKDLGVGDGTRQTRAVALASASRMYEQEVAGGAIRGIIRGRVAQLMLIQIQQLKADLLQAMDQIDNLVDANRLNVQLVASIPAVLILIWGTRGLLLLWSNVRMKDLRLPRDVHAEMADYLKSMEEVLILANHELDSSSGPAGSRACLGPKDMGKLLLWMHLYLNLLDYMSPPFPSKNCDSIHQSMQKLLMQGQMSTSRQLELLKVIQEKHNDFLKTLPVDFYFIFQHGQCLPQNAPPTNSAQDHHAGGAEALRLTDPDSGAHYTKRYDNSLEIYRHHTNVETIVLDREAAAHQIAESLPKEDDIVPKVDLFLPEALKDAIFVGHLVTDLDSVAGAIGAAALYGGKAATASEVNSEMEFALKQWGVGDRGA
ncbi:hypothetical protein HJC23_006689 [Cyclotella cryptica]|uniref:Uncharacterized protein n=1 Tax=Cyclotella cryptica TaxID=29204 RepID=A0ABD3QXB3_9STRA